MGIINKSTDPVEVKRISVRMWSLRDEIEHVLTLRQKECLEKNLPFEYEDIKEFYSRPSRFKYFLNADANTESSDDIPASDPNKDASGNAMDEDAMAMMNAMSEDKTPEAAPADPAAAGTEATPAPDSPEALAMAMLGEQKAQVSTASDTEIKATETKIAAHIKRIPPPEDKISYGFLLLSDVNMKYILVFTQNNYTIGSALVIEFLIPSRDIYDLELIQTAHKGRTSRVISEKRPEYRHHCVLTYNQPGQRDNLRAFLKSIEPTMPPVINKKSLAASKGESDADFDDLGL